jgi:hypothetical protein
VSISKIPGARRAKTEQIQKRNGRYPAAVKRDSVEFSARSRIGNFIFQDRWFQPSFHNLPPFGSN